MKFKSQVYTQVSGSLGGITYAHNRGGMYTRARSIPTNPSSAAQTVVRSNLAGLAQVWKTILTAAQRLAWENYAANSPVTDKFGDPLLLSGQQMYIRCNSVRLRGGAARVDDGPVTYGLATLTKPAFTASIAGGGVFVIFDVGDPWVDEDDAGLVVQTSRFLQPTINFFKGPFRYLATIDGDATTPPTTPADLGAQNAFGQDISSAVAGQAFYGRFTAFTADGRISQVESFNGGVIA